MHLVYATDLRVLERAGTVLVLGTATALSSERAPELFTGDLQKLLVRLARWAKPGDRGAAATSLTTGKPQRLVVGVLPAKVSRHNCAARPEPVFQLTASAGLEDGDAIVAVLDDAAHLLPVLNAIGRAFPHFQRKSSAREKGTLRVVALVGGKPVVVPPAVQRTVDLARSAARLVDTPPTELHPEALAREAKRMLAAHGRVKVREYVGPALLKAGLGGIHAVGRTAVVAPRMLVAEWKPARAKGPHVALVGKGVTFDTGGLHLKARGAMETMKADMGGAAAVLGAFCALIAEKPAQRLSLVLCLAENAIGPRSYKPDDILTLHSGKTDRKSVV